MDNRLIDDAILREYLLGRMEADQELVEHIDERILTDPEFSTSVEIVEDEIIEEYSEGSLDAADKQAVELHFLRPPERQRKLRNARLLSRHLAASPLHGEETPPQEKISMRTLPRTWPRFLTMPGLRACAEIAASILFATSILYFWNQQRKLEITVKQRSLQVDEERAHSAALDRQLQAFLPPEQSSIVMLTLVTPGLVRGDADLPKAKLGTAIKTLHIQVVFNSRPSEEYRVQLKRSGTVVWSQSGARAIAVSGGAILALDIPANTVPLGPCELNIAPAGEPPASYWFLALKLP